MRTSIMAAFGALVLCNAAHAQGCFGPVVAGVCHDAQSEMQRMQQQQDHEAIQRMQQSAAPTTGTFGRRRKTDPATTNDADLVTACIAYADFLAGLVAKAKTDGDEAFATTLEITETKYRTFCPLIAHNGNVGQDVIASVLADEGVNNLLAARSDRAFQERLAKDYGCEPVLEWRNKQGAATQK